MARVCVAGSKVMIGVIGGAGEVVGVAHGGGMDQTVSVGVNNAELSSFYNLVSVSFLGACRVYIVGYSSSHDLRLQNSASGNKPRRPRPPNTSSDDSGTDYSPKVTPISCSRCRLANVVEKVHHPQGSIGVPLRG